MEVSSFRAIILAVVIILNLIFIQKNPKFSKMNKMYFVFSIVGIVIYSGVSTVYKNFCEEYFGNFIFYICCFSLGFYIAKKIRFVLSDKKDSFDRDSTVYHLDNQLLVLCVIIFFSYYFIQLIYPTFRLGDLFHVNLSIDNIFARREAMRGNAIYQIFYYMHMMTQVFFSIYVLRMFKQKKFVLAVSLYLLDFYLSVVVLGYVGRTEIIAYLIPLAIMVLSVKDEQFSINKKFVFLFIVSAVAFAPLLLAYQSMRQGIETDLLGVGESISVLVKSETTYGQYYDLCNSITNRHFTLSYFIWLITMPFPSAIFKFKNNLVMTNVYFSEILTGVAYGDPQYSTFLPSLFGESIILFGKNFAFIHALFLGYFLCKFSSAVEKNKELEFINLCFAANCLLLGRGATASILPYMINTMVFYLLVMVVLRYIKQNSNVV